MLFSNSEEDSPLKILIKLSQKTSKHQYFDFLIIFLNLVLFDVFDQPNKKNKPIIQEKILKKLFEKKLTVPQLKKFLLKSGGGVEGKGEEVGGGGGGGGELEGGEGEGERKKKDGVGGGGAWTTKKYKKKKDGEIKRVIEDGYKKEEDRLEGGDGKGEGAGGKGEGGERGEGEGKGGREFRGLKIFWLRGKIEEFFGSIIDLKKIKKNIEKEFREEKITLVDLEKSKYF